MVKTTKPSKHAAGYVLGRHGFAKISAVEGIRTTREMDKEFGEFDRKNLPAKVRREALSSKYGKR